MINAKRPRRTQEQILADFIGKQRERGIKLHTQNEVDLILKMVKKDDKKSPFANPTELNNYNIFEQEKKKARRNGLKDGLVDLLESGVLVVSTDPKKTDLDEARAISVELTKKVYGDD